MMMAGMPADAQRETIRLDKGWKFHFGNAADPAKDFGCGTEYFNYLTKANSIHNEGPYIITSKNNGKEIRFDDSDWQDVTVPHDFVVQLPFAKEASHSHGYKTVGYKYTETSVGWYRKTFRMEEAERGRHVELLFDGIFRDSRVWVNGFYCGGERSGYLSQSYDITDYLVYGADNLICVRADATLEEGWFYEGGGIYRNAWLVKTDPVHIADDGITITTTFSDASLSEALLSVKADIQNSSHSATACTMQYNVLDAGGKTIATFNGAATTSTGKATAATTDAANGKEQGACQLLPMQLLADAFTADGIRLSKPNLWSPDTPYLYILEANLQVAGKTVDTQRVKFGIRDVRFDKDRGFLLNGKEMKLKGVNMHQDHAGTGAAIPDGLQAYRIKRLKEIGCNAYRSSHNPMSPAMLDACDSLGMLVIDENRLSGISEYEVSSLEKMIRRDKNHPSIILWSAGNEEWGIEWDERGERIAATLRDYCHRFDPTREMTFATSGGPTVEVPVDVAGYNYVMQNPIDEHRKNYPERRCYGSEETSGCGTRGIYYNDANDAGRMVALNRVADEKDGCLNRIERGWQFYADRPWAAGCFFWTGFDYRGEPNPLSYPATGSEFGILDYCGFPKDEAYYLKSWWQSEPVLHILPHWNLKGHEGETVSVWAYSNCDEVELYVNGKSLGRKAMSHNGHLEWDAVYQPGKVRAVGYRNGKKVAEETIATAGSTAAMAVNISRHSNHDGSFTTIVDVTMKDKKGNFVPDACELLTLHIDGDATVIGAGNGDPEFLTTEQPAAIGAKDFSMKAFNGCAQFIINTTGTALGTITANGCKPAKINL